MEKPRVESFFDPATWTVTHVVYEDGGQACAIVDPVLDYDPKSGRTSTASADKVADFVRDKGLRVEWLLETHAHADHLSAAAYLRGKLGGRIGVGAGITRVQGVFGKLFNLGAGFATDGSQFDHLFADGEPFGIGGLRAEAVAVPGHTPACVAYKVGDAVFVGDTIFMPDVGTARCDFPGGDPHALYRSIRRILALPDGTRLYMCHDYPPEGRQPAWQSSVRDQRLFNVHVHDGVDEEAFVAMRNARDRTLEMPVLILPSVQVNIRGGAMPPPEANGVSYLKIPLNAV